MHCSYMCQQAVEKALKSLIAANNEIPAPIHNLPALAMDAGVWDDMNMDQRMFLRALTTYAIEARYPERKYKLNQQCTRDEAERILKMAKEIMIWVKSLVDGKLSQEK